MGNTSLGRMRPPPRGAPDQRSRSVCHMAVGAARMRKQPLDRVPRTNPWLHQPSSLPCLRLSSAAGEALSKRHGSSCQHDGNISCKGHLLRQGQRPDALAGQCEDGVGECRCRRRCADFADAAWSSSRIFTITMRCASSSARRSKLLSWRIFTRWAARDGSCADEKRAAADFSDTGHGQIPAVLRTTARLIAARIFG